MTVAFSERSDVAGEPNPLSRALAEARARGPVLDLTVSNPADAELAYDRGAIARALSAVDATRYAPHPLGLPSAREALAARGLIADPARALLTASTSEAYAYLFRLLADRGDELLVPAPSYPLLEHLAHAAEVELSPYPLVYDGAWRAPLDLLHDAIGPRTRAIVVVSPNNPTGSALDVELAAGLEAMGLPVVIDEVFGAYPLEAALARVPVEGTLTFRLDGLSKRAALPGMKLAWASVEGPPAQVTEAMARLEVMADAFLSPSAPAQQALAGLLDATAPTRDAIAARTRANLDALREAIAGTALSAPRVDGGWYAPVRLPATRTDEAWALALLERGVHAHPGYLYDFDDEEAWLVLGLLTPRAAFDEGVGRLIALVNEGD